MPYEEFPKWIDVDGPGHPQNPGKVLVNNEDEESRAKAENTGPAYLNPPPDAGQKTLEEMDREELKLVLMREGIPDDMTDDEIRNAIRHGRERRAEHAREDAEEAQKQRHAREAGGNHGDGQQTKEVPHGDAEAPKDAAGDAIPADPADEANKVVADDPTRDGPAAKSSPATDNRPEEARKKVADDAPAGNISEAAATPPDQRKGTKKPN